MRLAGVRPGDIVQVDKRGAVFLATVVDVDGQRLSIEPHSRGFNYHAATSREVKQLWRKAGRRS